jgi:phosphate transport system substrate-binding protein
MNKKALATALVLCTAIIYTSCDKMDHKGTRCPCFERIEQVSEENFVGIENITFENYPKVDGSTSAIVLSRMVAYKLLDIPYVWYGGSGGMEWSVTHNLNDVPEEYKDFFWGGRIKTSQTHGAFMNLIDGDADIILTHRTISPDEKVHADDVGVTLIETPIALDAFVFVVNKNNPVQSLTVEQVQKIYTGEITNWQQVGGNNASIKVFTRPRNSGSEEVFRKIVMGDLEPLDFPEAAIGMMILVFYEVTGNVDGICYTFDNYKEVIARERGREVATISINGIFPDKNTVQNGTFPFISKVHVAIRSNLDRNSMAYKLYEWLQTENVKPILTECGFVTK